MVASIFIACTFRDRRWSGRFLPLIPWEPSAKRKTASPFCRQRMHGHACRPGKRIAPEPFCLLPYLIG